VIDKELLEILACPETRQPLAEATPEMLARVNASIRAGAARNRAGKPVEREIEGGLVREDGRVLYPIRDRIPVLLVDEGIAL
jgi:uncharacterized protein YbaR (Trm112 family)